MIDETDSYSTMDKMASFIFDGTPLFTLAADFEVFPEKTGTGCTSKVVEFDKSINYLMESERPIDFPWT